MDDDIVIPNHWLDDLVGLPPLRDSDWRREPFPYRGWGRFWHCFWTSTLLGMIPWGFVLGLMIKFDVAATAVINPGTVALLCVAPIFLQMFFSKAEYG